MAKVLYDHQVFGWQNVGGVSRYFSELIKHNQNAQLSLKYSDNAYIHDEYFRKFNITSKKDEFSNFLVPFNFKGKGRLFNYYKRFFKKDNLSISINKIKKSDYEIFHPTYYEPYFLQYIQDKPFILTVHDMIHELFPQYYPDDITIDYKKRLIMKANRIIAVSENTKNDIVRFFPESQGKINVVYHGASFEQTYGNIQKENYILFVGSRAFYKNFDNFVKAVAPLLIKYDLYLKFTGIPFNSEESFLLDELNISDRATSKYVSDVELKQLYSRALAFVFPSFYEGFGIPVLESFALNCPALLANTTSLPEVGGNAAVYFDPNSVDDMRNQIDRVISSPEMQKELIEKGKERLKLFSWKKCTNETLGVYKNTI